MNSRRTKEEWSALLREWAEGSETAEQFAKRHRIRLKMFTWWISQFRSFERQIALSSETMRDMGLNVPPDPMTRLIVKGLPTPQQKRRQLGISDDLAERHVVAVSLPDALYSRLAAEARTTGHKPSSLVRHHLEASLDAAASRKASSVAGRLESLKSTVTTFNLPPQIQKTIETVIERMQEVAHG